MLRHCLFVVVCPIVFLSNHVVFGETVEHPARMTLTGDWSLSVEYENRKSTVSVSPAEILEVVAEKHDRMPPYDERRTWNPAMAPNGIRGEEGFPTTFALQTDSVIVRDGDGPEANAYEPGRDFKVLPVWGAIGRTPESRIGENQPVWLTYRYGKMRIDSIVRKADGTVAVREGTPHIVMPEPPEIGDDELRLGNIWIKARIEKLEPNLLFPILETAYPGSKAPAPAVAETRLPKTLQKLRDGGTVKILAWGDSVTVGSYLKTPADRWQEQFVARLRQRFPRATIELITEAWGGRTTTAYLAQPPESEYHFKTKVLDPKPDLIVMEFVNDAGLPLNGFEERHLGLLEAFRNIGAEWIILTPHYVRPDWMGLDRERDIDEDPRAYVKALRDFARKNNVALADGAARYGRLWRQGIPYSTLMSNNINHPNKAGLTLFADALMELFPAKVSGD